VSGYLSDDPAELAGRARQLLADPALAARLGAAARETARARFSHARFAAALALAIDKARARWAASGMLTA
jgi:glycosyltransferase involved in cell wall biosynthesis